MPFSVMEAPNPATKRLWQVLEESKWVPELQVLRECVEDGADVLYTPDIEFRIPILHKLAYLGNVEAFRQCLETRRNLNFDLLCEGDTVMHYLGESNEMSYRGEQTVAMVRAVCDRLALHPNDRLDWSLKNEHDKDFLDLVCEKQLLCLVWPIITDVPYFADYTSPIPLCVVWSWEWEALGEEERAYFDISAAEVICGSEVTGRLWKISHSISLDVEEVRECVALGGDVMFSPYPDKKMPILLDLAYFGQVEAFRVCLETRHPLDFNKRDYDGGTVMHFIASSQMISDEAATTLVRAICERLLAHAGKDRLDWGSRNGYDEDFLTLAARSHRLSAFWPSLRALPFFAHGRFSLPAVWLWDWEALGESGVAHFDITNAQILALEEEEEEEV